MKSPAEELEEIAQPLLTPSGAVVRYVDFDEVVALMKRREAEVLRDARRAPAEKPSAPPGSW